MFCIRILLLILCTVQIIKALSVNVDGRNLGSTWKYEFGIAGIAAEKATAASPRPRKNNVVDRIRKDEERLRKAEVRLRKQAEAHRNKMSIQLRLGKRHSNKEGHETTPAPGIFGPFLSWLSQYISFNYTKPEEKAKNVKEEARIAEEREIVFNSDSDAIDSSDTMTFEPERSTRPLGRTPKENYDQDSSQTQESSELQYNSEPTEVWKGLIVNGDASLSSFEANNHVNIHLTGVEHRAGVTDANPVLPVNPHKVRDDTKITDFTNHIYHKTLKLFENVEKETNDENMKGQIKDLGKNYENKFKEFLRDSGKQTIKTRLGTQKVVLSAIETSDRILRRLLNFMVADMDGKGALRNNEDAAKTFKNAIEREQKVHLLRACTKFGICHSGPVFSGFVADNLGILLKMDSEKFNQTLNVLIRVIKSTDFEGILTKQTETKLKASLRYLERQKFKPMLVLLRNIISNKNRPLIVNNMHSRRRILDSTVALLEIIDVLDRKIPSKKANEWQELRNGLQEFADGKRTDLKRIIEAIVERVMKNLTELNRKSRGIISKNLDVIIDSFL